jgi:hypothetical protein
MGTRGFLLLCKFVQTGGICSVGWRRRVMQVLIRRAGTSLYWNAAGRWTRRREHASDLREVCRAVLLCLHRGWRDAELVIRFEQMSGEMTVPVASLPGADRYEEAVVPQRAEPISGGARLCRRLWRWANVLPFRRRKAVTFGCRRNIGPGGYGRR